ncbi:unnamed protein product [Urochloa decumbens]|uniref:F-box domain-containing protein n=1 Tax=Urochloa decumbens TaxID=240449 RepID=A0ABC8Y9U5_9POAL
MAPAADRISDIADDLLVQIISFLPFRDAARTAVLARRWRPLWLLTGTAINLDSRSYRKQTHSYYSGDEIDGERLFADAYDAVNAATSPVRSLWLFMEAGSEKSCDAALGTESRGWYRNDDYNRLQDLLAEPSLRHLEEIRVGFHFPNHRDLHLNYKLKLVLRQEFLPWAQNLRVLDLACCRLKQPDGGGGTFSLPRLASLRLVFCSMPTAHLEALIRAAPGLAALHIEHLDSWCYGEDRPHVFVLHCPNLAALTIADTYFGSVVEVYAPRLCSFSYSGASSSGEFCMKSAMTNLMEVNLNLSNVYSRPGEEDRRLLSRFLWKFLGIFRGTKALKLQLLHMEHLAADEGELDEPLPVLHGLERLELEVPQDTGDCRKDSAAAIATLLRQCPVIRHCLLRFSETDSWRRGKETDARPEFDVSVDLFNRRESKEIALMVEGDGDDSSSTVPDLPGLTGGWFSCLQSHLKYVKLQFEFKRLNCFEVCLAKFFAENCKVLEVLQIEDGDQHFLSHINRKVERWRLNALNQSDRT